MVSSDLYFFLSCVWFYGISTIVGYLMSNPFLYILTVLFRTIQLSRVKWFYVLWCITNYSIKNQSFIYTQLNVKNSSILKKPV